MSLSYIFSLRPRWGRMLTSGCLIGGLVFPGLCLAQGDAAEEPNDERMEVLIDQMWDLEYDQPEEALAMGEELLEMLNEHPDQPMLMRVQTILAAIYRHLGRFEEGIEAATRAEMLAETLKQPEAEAKALREKVIIYLQEGKPYLGLQMVDAALALTEQTGAILSRADLLHLKGMLNEKLGDYPQAMENLLESRKIRLENGREDTAAHSNNSLGILSLEIGDLDGALQYHLKNKAYWESKDDQVNLSSCYANLGDVYKAQGEFDKALEYHQRSMKIEQETKNIHGEIGSLLDIGEVYIEQKNFTMAEQCARKALSLNQQLKSSYVDIRCEHLMGISLAGQGNFKEAMIHLDDALDDAHKLGSRADEKDLLLEKSRLYEQQSLWEEALDYYKEYQALSKSIIDEQKVRSIAELQERYQAESKAREIELLRARESINQLNLEKQEQAQEQLLQEKQSERNLRWVLITGIVLLLGGIVILVFLIFQKQASESRLRRSNEEVLKQKKRLESQTRQIEASNENLSQLNVRLRELNQALQQSPVSVMVTDIQGTILYVNDKFCEVSGYTQEEILGCNPKILRSGNMADEVYRSLWNTALKGQVWTGELENRKKSGELFWERSTVAPIYGEDGKIVRLLGVKEDITQERAHAEETLRSRMHAEVAEASDKAKSVFLKAVGQEMRSPLNSILGFCNLLAQSQMDKDQLKYLNQIGQSGFQLLTLIEKILDFTSAESGTMTFDEKLIRPEQIGQNIYKQFLTRAAERNLELKLDTEGLEEPEMLGDERRIRQVLDILVDNAIKFTNEGTISIRLKSRLIPEFDQIELRGEIEDTGIGMSPTQLKELFKPFPKDISMGKTPHSSTGLGLALCQRVCSLLGGRIEASRTMEQGSVFTFIVKAKPADKSPETEEGGEQFWPDNEHFGRAFPLRIMVAEDNRVNRRLVETMMERLGYAVTFAVDGTEVLSELRKSSFDIIFMDLQMPNMGGVEATRHIRSGDLGEAHRDIYVVAVTAFASDDMRQACEEVNMQAFIAKPFDVEVIKEQIVKAYQAKQLKHE